MDAILFTLLVFALIYAAAHPLYLLQVKWQEKVQCKKPWEINERKAKARSIQIVGILMVAVIIVITIPFWKLYVQILHLPLAFEWLKQLLMTA